jgi:hypothetical protein
MKAITRSRTSFDFGNLIICDCNYDQKLNQFVHSIKKAASVAEGRLRFSGFVFTASVSLPVSARVSADSGWRGWPRYQR